MIIHILSEKQVIQGVILYNVYCHVNYTDNYINQR